MLTGPHANRPACCCEQNRPERDPLGDNLQRRNHRDAIFWMQFLEPNFPGRDPLKCNLSEHNFSECNLCNAHSANPAFASLCAPGSGSVTMFFQNLP